MTTHQEELIKLAQSLIRIPSVTGSEANMAAFVREYLQAAGFEAFINEYNTVIAVLRRGTGPTVLLDGHLDTVDANPAEWRHPPYAGEIEGSRIYGRGASDMKGALAAMLYAGKALAKETSWAGTLIITGTSWEEQFEGYTLGRAIEQLSAKGLRPDYVIIGEASELNLKRGQRGRTRIYVDVQGKPAHSAHPEKGINAVYQAVKLIERIRSIPLKTDDFLGSGIIELIGIDSLPKPVDSVVPYACRISYDLRLLPSDDRESILASLANIINALQREDSTLQAKTQIAQGELVTNTGQKEIVEAFPPAWKLEENHPLVQTALGALRSIGLDPQTSKYGFCTNGSYSAGIAKIPTIGFGPGTESGAHIIDECIEIADLCAASAGYQAIVRSLGS